MVGCHNCGGSNTARNDDRGETICTDCGAVLAASAMVDSISFVGGGKMSGQFIDRATGNTRGFASRWGNRDTREQALARGFDNMGRVAHRLRLDTQLMESAKLVYKLAMNRGFTQGRPNYLVVSACLYAVCRRSQSAHMLIDFSDALLTPVRDVARVYTKLVHVLKLAVPTIDPSLFMGRFAADMDLGDKESQVAATGVRLVQAMARDWISTGRRPLGLCASALLIAARYHGIKLNSEDIDQIFRISAGTIDKRLREFKKTAVAALPAKDFESTNLLTLPILTQPPCTYKRTTRFEAIRDIPANAEDLIAIPGPVEASGHDMKNPTHKNSSLHGDQEDEILSESGAHLQNDKHAMLEADTGEFSDAIETKLVHLTSSCDNLAGSIILHPVNALRASREDLRSSEIGAVVTNMVTAIGDAAEEIKDTNVPSTEMSTLRDVIMGVGDNASKILSGIAKDFPLDELFPTDDNSLPNHSDSITAQNTSGFFGNIEAEQTKIERNGSTKAEDKKVAALNDTEEEILSEDDNELLDGYILTREESYSKAAVWDILMGDVLPFVEERRLRRLGTSVSASSSGRKKRAVLGAASDAADSIRMALQSQESMVLTRMNDNILEDLFG